MRLRCPSVRTSNWDKNRTGVKMKKLAWHVDDVGGLGVGVGVGLGM